MAANQPPSSHESLVRAGSQLLLRGFPVLSRPDEAQGTKYFSLNPFVPDERNRCPLECAYCVCHQDHSWHHHPEQYEYVTLPSDLIDRLIDDILATREGQRGVPISLCDYSDPFLPVHRERVLTILQVLIDRNAANLIYITTKVHPGQRFLRRLRELLSQAHGLRPTIFVSLPPLKPGYERVSIDNRVRLLKDLVAAGLPCCWYMRPLVQEWYDERLLRRLARELLPHVGHHVILSGIVMSHEVEASLLAQGLAVPQWDRTRPGKKQYLSRDFEMQLHTILGEEAAELGISLGQVMGHRLCGVNGNHAYGCLLCAKQDRYCQLFQRERYDTEIKQPDPERLVVLLRAGA